MLKTILILLFYVSVAESREVTFSWEPFENVLGYQIEVSPQMNFETTSIKKIMKTPTLTTELPMGTYYYRVRAIDMQKKAGYWSEPMKVIVSPYPPELTLPKNISEYSYFEIPPKIEFSWKPTEGEPIYELYIYKTTGKKMFEQKTSKPSMIVNSLHEGEYMWKVRTIYKNIYQSDYGEPRRFTIEKKPISEPILLDPIQNKQLAAYHNIKFSWSKDRAAHYTDIKIEKIEKGKSKVVHVENNIFDSNDYQYTIEDDGHYIWTVTTKEDEKTQGLTSEPGKFLLQKDMISSDNYSMEFGLGLFSQISEFQNDRAGAGTRGSLSKTYSIFNLSGSYFLSESTGFRLNLAQGAYSDNLPLYDWQFSLSLRMGTSGFKQEFLLGYRQKDVYEFLTSPSPTTNSFTSNGPTIGTIIHVSVAPDWRIRIGGAYFKPISFREDLGNVIIDHYDSFLGVGWNPFYKFWVNYQLSYNKTIFTFSPNNSTGSSFTSRTEFSPFFITFSLEH